MARSYRWIATADLIQLRKRHQVALRRAALTIGYFARQDCERIAFHIHEIDVELAARAAQQKLL